MTQKNSPTAWISAALIGMALLSMRTASAFGSADAVEKIETTNAVLSFKPGSGDLIGVQWKRPKLDIIGEPRLGENFRILLPKPDYEANYFNSRDQVVGKIEQSADRIVLHYGPLKNAREEVDVRVAYEIRDTGTQLQFSIQVENETDLKLAEVAYAILGGLQGIGDRLETETLIPGPSTAGRSNFAPRLFSQFSGFTWYATPFAFAGYRYPGDLSMGWMDVYNRKAGIGYYYANQDPETRLSNLYMELHPYMKRGSPQDNWASASQLPASEPRGLTMGWVHFPYTAHGTFRAGPVALQVHPGDWHAAAHLYRDWFDQHFKVARPLDWLQKEMAWQSVNLLTPEDEVFYRYRDLPKLAADAKKYGVTTFLIFGWAVGGQDRSHPNWVPDPRLGTREEFRAALADIRALGVHPLLGANIHMADPSTEEFKTRYARYARQARWMPNWYAAPSGFGTIGARVMDVARYHTFLSPAHPEFREEILGKHLDLIRDGAEGLMQDAGGFNGFLDFNPDVPTSPDKSLPQGLQTTYQEFLSRARLINPDVALAVSGSFDRYFPYDDVGMAWLEDMTDGDMPLRYTFPEWRSIAGATVPEAFDRMNNGLRYGLVWQVAPREMTASMDEPLTRPLSRYVSELIRIRKQYADLLFRGRFNDTLGAEVHGDTDDVRYSVFAPMATEDPRRAVVVVNFGEQEQSVSVAIPGRDGQRVRISAPFEADRTAVLSAKLTLPAHRAAVIVAGK